MQTALMNRRSSIYFPPAVAAETTTTFYVLHGCVTSVFRVAYIHSQSKSALITTNRQIRRLAINDNVHKSTQRGSECYQIFPNRPSVPVSTARIESISHDLNEWWWNRRLLNFVIHISFTKTVVCDSTVRLS